MSVHVGVIAIAQIVSQMRFGTGGMEVVLNIILMIDNNKARVQPGNLLVCSEPSPFRVEPKIKVAEFRVAPVWIWFWCIRVSRLLLYSPVNRWWYRRRQQLFKLIRKARNVVVALGESLFLWIR